MKDMNKFKFVDGDESSTHYERTLNGKLTKSRYKLLSSYVRKKSYTEHCGCEWDCCGCLFQVSYGLQIINNQVTIQMSEYRNY